MARSAPTPAELQDLRGCFCLALRRTTRAVTQLYDAALRPFGVRVTQLPILTVAASRDRVPVAELAEVLGMERTTLLRNLRPLVRERLVELRRESGSRRMELLPTAKGRALLSRAYPAWRSAQERVKARLGESGLPAVLSHLEQAARESR